MEQEIWKSVLGYEGFYEISNLGRVKSLDRQSKKNNRVYKGRVLNCTVRHGYREAGLRGSDGCQKHLSVHRLVAIAFIPNIENKPQVNHINGIKTDNRVENLEWCTSKENVIHAVNNRLRVAANGESHYNCKITDNDVREIRNLYVNSKETYATLSKKYNTTPSTIGKIIRREKRKYA